MARYARHAGERVPRTRAGIPHQQLDQIAPAAMQEALWSRMLTLPGVRATGSLMSLPDTRALQLNRAIAQGPQSAFAPDGGTEFAHLHGRPDGSLHMNLPIDVVESAIAAGWAELHPYVLKGWVRGPPAEVRRHGCARRLTACD